MNNKSKGTMDTIPCRIEFIKELLKDKKLDPLVDFDQTNTDYFLQGKGNNKDENESGESYDTRIVLKKRFHDFTSIIHQIGGRLKYIKSGTTGHTFKGETKDEFGSFEYAVKVVAYPKKERYGDFTDVRRPENAELMMIKLLSYFIIKKQTPHIVLPIGTFDTDIKVFLNLVNENVIDNSNEKYNDFVKGYKNGEYYDNVSILISEWANRGDLLDFIRKNYKDFTTIRWKVIFFQFISVLAIIQSKYPSFRHNDLKANNVLIHKIAKQNERFAYRINGAQYKVPNIGYHIKLWDFDFACIPGVVDNKKVESQWTKDINVTPVQNRYYDVHYFFSTLIKKGFCPEIMTSSYVSDEVKDFINRVVPKIYQKTGTKYVHKKGRILVNDEYVTPDEILKNDPFFEEFRVVKNNVTTNNTSNNIPNNISNNMPNNISNNMPKNITNSTVNVSSFNKNTKKNKNNIPDLTKFLRSNSDSSKEKQKTNKIKTRNKKNSKNKKRTVSVDSSTS